MMSRIIISGFFLVAILLFGTFGYMAIERSTFIDSLYMTMITITTVGYGEVIALSPVGKLFTMVLILVGVGFVLFLVSKITEAMVEGGLRRIIGGRQMQKKLSRLKDHYIVCGFGRIGKVICKQLEEDKKDFIVIETDPKEIKLADELGYLVMDGEASNDDVLIKAGIMKAKGLIAVVSTDADNVYISLSARGINPDLFILARSGGVEGSETKLLRAGADKVISPYYIGGCRMAQLLMRPTVVDFIDLTVHGGELGLRLEELRVSDRAPFIEKSLQESGIRKMFDLIVVAIKREVGEMFFNPSPNTVIMAGDILVVLGSHESIKGLEKQM